MENTTIDRDALLENLNEDMAVMMTPVMILLLILMIIGLFGNGMVCYYYSCKSRQSSNTVFIVAVAVYDLIVCTLSIPIEIVDLRFFYLFTNSGACAFMRFVNYFGAIGSVFTLLVISVDRYRKICKPFRRQLKLREAKIACGISVLISLIFSWPALVFYRSVRVEVQTDDGIMLEGRDCTTTREDDYKIFLWIFNGIYLVCFLISSVVLCVMYGMVGIVLFRHNKYRKRYSSGPTCVNSDSMGADTNLKDCEHTRTSDKNKYIVNKPKQSETDASVRRSVENIVSFTSQRSTENCENKLDIKTIKYTTMMLVITVVFIMSYLPHLILSLWRTILNEYEGDVLSNAGLLAFQIGLRSYFLNSAINPFAYGFFNPKFRNFFYLIFCPCCKTQPESNTVSTTSDAT